MNMSNSRLLRVFTTLLDRFTFFLPSIATPLGLVPLSNATTIHSRLNSLLSIDMDSMFGPPLAVADHWKNCTHVDDAVNDVVQSEVDVDTEMQEDEVRALGPNRKRASGE